jgi:hypothetical protein
LKDVAGLVPGASEGKGLGNQFLDDLRDADVFVYVVDASGETDEGGKPTKGYNPCRDVEFLEDELNKWYYNILMKVWKGFARKAELEKSKFSEAVAKRFSGLKVKEEHVKEAMLKLSFSDKPSTWKDDEVMKFAETLRHISKPMIIAANKCDLGNAKENICKMKKEFPKLEIVACSADSELALRNAAKAGLIEYIPGESDFKILKELNEKQKEALDKIKKDVLGVYGSTGVQDILNKVVFDILGYLAIFPGSASKLGDSKGNILPDCFLLPSGSTALDFAYFLHTDFGKNFIKAINAKTKMVLGKDYKLKHRDSLEIITR